MSLKLNEFIKEYGGATKLAAKLNMGEQAVRVWMRGDGSPSAKVIDEIIKISKGKLTFDDIFKCSTRNQK